MPLLISSWGKHRLTLFCTASIYRPATKNLCIKPPHLIHHLPESQKLHNTTQHTVSSATMSIIPTTVHTRYAIDTLQDEHPVQFSLFVRSLKKVQSHSESHNTPYGWFQYAGKSSAVLLLLLENITTADMATN